MRPTAIVAGFAALALVLAVPATARAQSAIAGVVRDTSGAVLPGVTVEIASDVLIERTRSAVTDSDGQYKIIDLRPGVYVMTFGLEGFQSIRRYRWLLRSTRRLHHRRNPLSVRREASIPRIRRRPIPTIRIGRRQSAPR